MSDETLVHLGVTYRVAKQSPTPNELLSGVWLRICYDPYDSKPDTVGEVLASERFWANTTFSGLRDDYRITLARNGDPNETYQFLLSEEYVEILESVETTYPPTNPFKEKLYSSKQGTRARTNIVVCFDGTWNENETQNTNVHRAFELLDRRYSISNYYSGVGIGGRAIGNILDAVGGRGVFRSVRAAYTFVRGNFIDGDRIFIFGFSRGAYAARHLAGMIARVGVNSHTEVGYNEYKKSLGKIAVPKPGGPDRDVHFLGLFDCVPGTNSIRSEGSDAL